MGDHRLGAPSLVDSSERPLLIVNADDFALTPATSTAILEAHRAGIVTSTSVLAVGSAFEGAIGSARDSGIGVGVHLALVGEDPPLLGAAEIPSLVRRDGSFRRSWRELSAAEAARRIDPDDVRRELGAQIDRVVQAGICPTHVDSHQHVHLLAGVGSTVLDLASSRRIGAVRIPDALGRRPTALAVRGMSRRLRGRATARGFRTPDAFGGLDVSGHLSAPRFVELVRAISTARPRSAEIGVHPGPEHDPDRYRFRWGFDWPGELEAVTADSSRQAVRAAGFRLGSFADLPAP